MSELRVGVLTCSDALAAVGDAPSEQPDDAAGMALIAACEGRGWVVVAYHVCLEDAESIATSLNEMCDVEEADIVFTIGGTGLGPRDVTPEVTAMISERLVPGIAEAVRHRATSMDRSQMLSRATAGVRGSSLIINLPDACVTTLDVFDYIADLMETAAQRIRGAACEG